jgi:hypothetical protein
MLSSLQRSSILCVIKLEKIKLDLSGKTECSALNLKYTLKSNVVKALSTAGGTIWRWENH